MDKEVFKTDLKSYIIGFALSIFFTLLAFMAVMQNLFVGKSLVMVLIVLALLQAVVQLVFFLHLKPWVNNQHSEQEKEDAKWNLAALILTVGLIVIVVVGALWIMNHLNYNMTPGFVNSQMIKMEGIK